MCVFQQLSVAVCIGFLGAWSPYAIVAMWAAFGDATIVPPAAFALAAIFAKSSTIYNPMVYLLCKPNFRKCLCRDTSTFRNRICRGSPRPEQKDPFGSISQPSQRNNKEMSISYGQPESPVACLHCAEDGAPCQTGTTSQRTAYILTGSTYGKVTVNQLSANLQADFL